MGPTAQEIHEARRRIANTVWRTPLERSAFLSEHTGHDIYLKLECWQRTRSFKMRGASNAIAALDDAARARGLVTASAGNHGQAIALAAREAGVHATIFVPSTAPETKKARIRTYGATLNEDAPHYDAAEVAAQEYAQTNGATFVHAFSDCAVVAGQGTVGAEILEDLPAVQSIVVPVGGGGLVSGVGIVAKDMNRAIRIAGVQSTETHAMHAAFAAGKVVDTPITPTLADGLAGATDQISYERARAVVDDMLLVEESAIPGAIRALYRYDGVVAEGSAAVAAAAILTGAVTPAGPTVLIITGGNIDARKLASILSAD